MKAGGFSAPRSSLCFLPSCELLRTPLPRSSVNRAGSWANKPSQAPSEACSNHTGSRRSACGLLRGLLLLLLLLMVLAGEVLRPGHDDHNGRCHAPPRGKQPGHSYQVRSGEHFTEESDIG